MKSMQSSSRSLSSPMSSDSSFDSTTDSVSLTDSSSDSASRATSSESPTTASDSSPTPVKSTTTAVAADTNSLYQSDSDDDDSTYDGTLSDESLGSFVVSEDEFEHSCFRAMERNHDVSKFEFVLNDYTAIQMALDLANNNTCTKHIRVVASSRLSMTGVKKFSLALRNSRIGKIDLRIANNFDDDRPPDDVVQRLYREVMIDVDQVCLTYLCDHDAALLETVLVGNSKQHLTKHLSLSVGSSLTTHGARCLIRGIQQSHVEHMSLSINASQPDNTRETNALVACHKFVRNRPKAKAHVQTDPSIASMLFGAIVENIPNVQFNCYLSNNRVLKLAPHLEGNSTLVSLSFQVSTLRLSGANALANALHSATLENIRLEILYSRDDSKAWRTFFCRWLQHENASKLVQVELKLTKYKPHSVRLAPSLAESLPFLTSLKRLSITNVHLGDEGIAALVDNWANNSPLQELELVNARIEFGGARRIASALISHPALLKLSLCRNPIACEGLEAIGMHFPNSRLREFHVRPFVTFPSRGNSDFFGTDWKLFITGLLSSYHLQVLDVPLRLFTVEQWKDIDFYLHLNRFGRYLLHTQHELPSGAWSHILAKCQKKISVIYYFLREQPNLVSMPASIEKGKRPQNMERREGAKRRKRRYVKTTKVDDYVFLNNLP